MPKITSYPRISHIGSTAFLAFVLSCLAGCATGPQTRPTAHASRTEALIFNPDWTNVAAFEPGRSEWPAVVASEIPLEAVDFQEVIHDLQGRAGFWGDNYYRQFDSVRFGHIRR